MDALTASAALVVVQLCVAAVMAGAYYVMPAERCTAYWAWSAVLIAAGVCITVINAGAPRYAILIIGNFSVILGLVLQWRGIRAFFRKGPGRSGWALGVFFGALYVLQLINGAAVRERSLLMACAILSMLILCAYELHNGQRGRRSFATVLTISGAAFLVLCYLVNIAASISGVAEFSPNTTSTFAIAMLYMVPIGGSLVLTTGSLLLMFERLLADKHHLATHDELTGILNRRAIVAGGEREVAIARRSKQPLTVAYVDIDHFKEINDRFGHEAGDNVIADVARTIQETCRSTDLVGRYGGEEFCIVLPGVGAEGATIFGERLLAAIRKRRFHGKQAVTLSAGLATWNASQAECSWPQLIGTADHALYKAKSDGRDRFSVAD
jgi:diguanylate cyclase (GGDEF)-like protein